MYGSVYCRVTRRCARSCPRTSPRCVQQRLPPCHIDIVVIIVTDKFQSA